MDSAEAEAESAPARPHPSPWRTVALVTGIVIGIYVALVGIVADLMSVITGLGMAGNIAILSAALGGGWVEWVRRTGRLHSLFDRRETSARAWTDRLIPVASFLLALILAVTRFVDVGGGLDPAENRIPPTPVAEPAPGPASECSEPATEKLVHMSHRALATAPGQDRGVDLNPGGYVQQRFFAATAQVASIAVIASRPGTEGPFDPQRIGQMRLTLYRADDQANNIEAIPLKRLESAEPPDPDGIVIDAGPNHEQTVFRFCPVSLAVGTRYAFRVTNATPGVVLALSLNTKAGPRTSIDIAGEIHGQDRRRINYFQVAGYVCSIASC